MKYATAIILWLAILVSEMHTAFSSTRMVAFHGVQMTEQWFVWLVGNSLFFTLAGLAIVFYQRNLVNWTAARAFLFFCTVDTSMFFINYKQDGYKAIYSALMVAWVIIYNYGRSKNRQGIITAG